MYSSVLVYLNPLFCLLFDALLHAGLYIKGPCFFCDYCLSQSYHCCLIVLYCWVHCSNVEPQQYVSMCYRGSINHLVSYTVVRLGIWSSSSPRLLPQDHTPKALDDKRSTSLGTSLARKNRQPLKRPCSIFSLASSSFTFFCSSASSDYNMMEKTRNKLLALPLLPFF